MRGHGTNGASVGTANGCLCVAAAAAAALLLASLAASLGAVVLASLGLLLFGGPPVPPTYYAIAGPALLLLWVYLCRSLYRRLVRWFSSVMTAGASRSPWYHRGLVSPHDDSAAGESLSPNAGYVKGEPYSNPARARLPPMSGQDHKEALPVGSQLDSYRVVRVLGAGGFGVTYLCEHVGLGVEVAVKEYLPNQIAVRDGTAVHPKSAGDREDFEWGLTRFQDEARTLVRFEHPNVVRVRDLFEANGTAYIVMDYEDGESLDRVLRRLGTLTEVQLKRVVLPVADALREVHAAGFLHRDVKPSNIFVRRSDESPVLLDFGSARQALGRKSRSMTAIASAGYAPPEQYESHGAQGAWTDIYALSALCYRAIAGETPVEALRRTAEVAGRRADPQESLAATGVAGYSSGFLRAVDWGLRLAETERPKSVDEWLARVHTGTGRDLRHTEYSDFSGDDVRHDSDAPSSSHVLPHRVERSRRANGGVVSKLMSGKFGLPITYWVFNWVVGMVSGSVLRYLQVQTESSLLARFGGRVPLARLLVIDLLYIAFLVLCAIVLIYSVIVVIGTWRAANAYNGWKGWATLAKTHLVVGVAMATLLVVFAGS